MPHTQPTVSSKRVAKRSDDICDNIIPEAYYERIVPGGRRNNAHKAQRRYHRAKPSDEHASFASKGSKTAQGREADQAEEYSPRPFPFLHVAEQCRQSHSPKMQLSQNGRSKWQMRGAISIVWRNLRESHHSIPNLQQRGSSFSLTLHDTKT